MHDNTLLECASWQVVDGQLALIFYFALIAFDVQSDTGGKLSSLPSRS